MLTLLPVPLSYEHGGMHLLLRIHCFGVWLWTGSFRSTPEDPHRSDHPAKSPDPASVAAFLHTVARRVLAGRAPLTRARSAASRPSCRHRRLPIMKQSKFGTLLPPPESSEQAWCWMEETWCQVAAKMGLGELPPCMHGASFLLLRFHITWSFFPLTIHVLLPFFPTVSIHI